MGITSVMKKPFNIEKLDDYTDTIAKNSDITAVKLLLKMTCKGK